MHAPPDGANPAPGAQAPGARDPGAQEQRLGHREHLIYKGTQKNNGEETDTETVVVLSAN